MNSIAAVTVAPSATNLTTLERVKQELGIAASDGDDLLAIKIAEASADIESQLGRVLARTGITETFWPVSQEKLVLDRSPVAAIESVTVDDVVLDASEYRLDAESGILFRLDASGVGCAWFAAKAIVVVYSAGFLLPGEADRNLPFALEGAAVDLVSSYWAARGRDATLKSEDIPGVIKREYWVGSVGTDGELPPNVMAKITPYRRPQV